MSSLPSKPASQASTPLSIMQKFYAAELVYMQDPTPANSDAFLLNLSPSVKLTQTPGLPYGGIYEGREGFKAWGTQMSQHFDVVDVQDSVIFTPSSQSDGSGPDGSPDNGVKAQVLVQSQLRLRVRKTKKELIYPMIQAITVNLEKAWIEEIHPFYWDVQGLNAALKEQ